MPVGHASALVGCRKPQTQGTDEWFRRSTMRSDKWNGETRSALSPGQCGEAGLPDNGEMAVSTHERITKLLWLGATLAVFAICGAWVVSGANPWAILPLAVSIVLFWAVAQWMALRKDGRRSHRRPLAGPRPGAWL